MNLTEDTRFRDFPDRLIRTLLEEPSNLREQVAASLPEVAARLDFERREVLNREFVLPDWRGREADLIFRVPFRDASGRSVLIVLMLEHQSSSDPVMPLRMSLLAGLFWEREWKTWEERHEPNQPLRLSTVIPIVFHTGRRSWNTNRELADLIDTPQELQAFNPRWPLLFWDLATQDVETLLASASAWLQALAVVRAEREDTERFREVLCRLLPRLTQVWEKEGMRGYGLLHFVLSWVARRRPVSEKAELEQQFRELVQDPRRQQEVLKMAETAWLSAEEEAELKAQERANRARLETNRNNLIDLLSSRFGTLPKSVIERIQGCSEEEKLRQAVRAFDKMTSLEQLSL